ncbi:MAG: protein phosphatase 2C domain-containing protein [Caldilineaceae bacterium]|nr:protein phosphatase 2C domain-containing protein [Caldilineaceae bacterium]
MASVKHHWQAIGASVRGASHIRAERPNQDALRWWPRRGDGSTLILAVADGHGGDRYTRSHIGAGIAVRTAVQVLSRDLLNLYAEDPAEPDLSQIKAMCEEWLPKVLVRRWQERVQRHLHRYPLRPNEQAHWIAAATSLSKPDHGLRAYGATLIALLLTPRFHLYLQLGDGDMLTIGADGRVSRPPLAADERLLGNDTTSLCMSDAWRSVRLYFQPMVAPPPLLILLATDGYANSFVDGDAFEQVGADLLDAIHREGHQAIKEQLPSWLAHTSASGSGDDITVALAIGREKS